MEITFYVMRFFTGIGLMFSILGVLALVLRRPLVDLLQAFGDFRYDLTVLALGLPMTSVISSILTGVAVGRIDTPGRRLEGWVGIVFGVGFSLFGGLAMARGLRREQTGGRRAVPEARIFLQQLTQSAADQAEALRHLDASIARLSAGAANVKKRRNSWLPNVLAILLIVGAVLLLSNDPDLIQPDKANWPTAAYYALLAAFLWVLALRLAVAFLRYRVARDLQLSVDLRYTVAQVSRSPGNAIPRLDRTPDSSPCLLTHNPNGAASLTRRRRPDRRASAPLRSASRAPAASLRDACAMASPPLTRTSAALLCSAT